MHKTALLARLPNRPSDLWSLPSLGYTPSQCLDFDFAIVDFWQWYEATSEEQVQRRIKSSDKLKDGHQWVKKHPTVDEILKQYYAVREARGPHYTDPLVAAMTDEEVASLASEIAGFGGVQIEED
jgi:hypothetical protein